MTDLSRGGSPRRGGRRPGWLLLTVLLVLAIAASSALVFTERVELLKLAVILSLWAAAAAAFVSVVYRRQSDVDRARARDLKLVYDLQLDREISARREYELEVESQLRRELSSELRGQATDEVAALRAELAALRNNLEIMFDADLSHRPALETERTTVRAYSDWQRDTDPGRARFVASAPRQGADDSAENAIIDVPEEPPEPQRDEVYVPPEPRLHTVEPEPQPQWVPPPPDVGSRHGRQRAEDEWRPVTAEQGPTTNGTSPAPQPAAAQPPRGRHSVQSEAVAGAPSARHSTGFVPPTPPPPQPPPPPPSARHGASDEAGQSVADLLARLQPSSGSAGGGRRRRRDG